MTAGILEYVGFTNTGPKPCVLDGHPKVVPLIKGGRQYRVHFVRLSGVFDYPRPIVLMPGNPRSEASVEVSVPSTGNITCHWSGTFRAYRVTLPYHSHSGALVVPIPHAWALGTCNHAFRTSVFETPGV